MSNSTMRLFLSFLLVVVVFVATGMVHYRAIETLVANQREQSAQRQVAIELSELISLATMAETGQRGFVITGREEYLQPYLIAREAIPRSLARLRQSMAHDARQLQRLDELDRSNHMKLAELDESITARRAGGFAAAAAIVLTNRGKSMMDDIRRIVADLDRVESARLAARTRESEASALRALRTIALAGGLDLALLILLYAGVQRNHRQQDRAARERADANALLRNVLDGSPALIYLIDLQGRFVLANKAFEAVFGAAAGKNTAELADAAPYGMRVDDIIRQDRQVLQTGEPVQSTQTVIVHGGERHFLLSKFALQDHRGAAIGIGAIAADITALKEAESEIRQLNQTLELRVDERTAELATANAKLLEVNEQLEAFSYTVAHDLRAPLRGIQGFADAVNEDYAGQLDATGTDYLRRISRAARRMEQLIADLLEFSRLSRMELTIGTVELDNVMQDVLHGLGATITDTRAEIDLMTGLPCVRANWSACVQIFQNLIGNALKFARPGLVPKVRIACLPTTGHEQVRIGIDDHGIGVPPDQRQRIFRPFERLHGIDEYAGSGIGLAIVDKASRRMQGSCGVDALPGGGARFWIELPACTAEAA